MSIGAVFIGIAMLVFASVVVTQPLRKKQSQQRPAMAVHTGNDYDTSLLALRDLEFDHQLGVVAEDDYARLRTQLMVQAAQALEKKDQARGHLEDTIEAAVQAQRQAKTKPEHCINCQEALTPGDKFCSHCGTPNEMACPACRQPVAADDKFCSGCGVSLQVRELYIRHQRIAYQIQENDDDTN